MQMKHSVWEGFFNLFFLLFYISQIDTIKKKTA